MSNILKNFGKFFPNKFEQYNPKTGTVQTKPNGAKISVVPDSNSNMLPIYGRHGSKKD